MSDNQKSLLGSFASSYGTSARDEEDPLTKHPPPPPRSRAWHKHDSDLMTGDHDQPSAFAPLIRTMSSDRAERVAESAAKDGYYEDKRKRPVAATPAETSKGGKRLLYGSF